MLTLIRLLHVIAVVVIISSLRGVGIVHTNSHIHFIAHAIETLGLTVHGNGSRDCHTICIFLCLNRALVRCGTLQAGTKWPFKSGLETLRQESEEGIACCRVG